MKKQKIVRNFVVLSILLSSYVVVVSCGNSSSKKKYVQDTTVECVPKKKPKKDIESPVKIKEKRVYASVGEEMIKNGLIVSYDNYVSKEKFTYNEDGYCEESLYESNSLDYQNETTYTYDFKHKNYSYVYSGLDKYVYDSEGLLVEVFNDGKISYQYKYNISGQEIVKIEYADEDWAYKTSTSYNGEDKVILTVHNKDGEEIKEKEVVEVYNSDKELREKTEYHYMEGRKQIYYRIVYAPDRRTSISYSYSNGVLDSKDFMKYNSKGDEIECISEGGEYPYKRNTYYEYDKYGNPTLQIEKTIYSSGGVDYLITLYSYSYYDGTAFNPLDKYSQLFLDVSSSDVEEKFDAYGKKEENYKGEVYGVPAGSHGYSVENTPKKIWHDCPLCSGTGRITYEANPSLYGQEDFQKYCSECRTYFMASTGHTHIVCKQCHGKKGYYSESY